MIIQLNASQVLLNKLYIPIIRNGRPSLIKSKEVDKIKVKLQELNSVKNQIAHKINIAPIVLNEFPTFASQILNQKLKFNMELQEVEAYSSFLSELLTINQDKLL